MEINSEDIRKISNLAKIRLKDSEIDSFKEDISSILDYVERLNKVSESVEEDWSSFNKAGDDKIIESSADEKERLLSSGKKKKDYFRVKKIN